MVQIGDMGNLFLSSVEALISFADHTVKITHYHVAKAHGVQMTTNCPPGEIEAEHPLVKAMMSAVSPGEPERAALKPFLASCEMAMLMEGLGIPALTFGPGRIRQAHITNEYVELDQLARGAEIFARMAVEYLGTAQEDRHG